MKTSKILLICHFPEKKGYEATISDHVKSIKKYSDHNVDIFNTNGIGTDFIPLENYDVLIIHYSICIARGEWLTLNVKKSIRHFKGTKILFIQDDYRWINATIANMLYMEFDALFCLTSEQVSEKIYTKHLFPNLHIETVLTGYITDEMLTPKTLIPYAERKFDVSYRARKLPFWLGKHALQKWQIAEKFLNTSQGYDLNCNISTKHEDRLYGKEWDDLLGNSRSVLLTESGASVCDFKGDLQKKVEDYTEKHPDASFEEVSKKFFDKIDGKLPIKVISPRIFESIASKTLQIGYEGEYQGILKPHIHYVVLNQNHSNMEDVLHILKDKEKVQTITDRAYKDILLNPSYHYRQLAKTLDDFIEGHVQQQERSIKHTTHKKTNFIINFVSFKIKFMIKIAIKMFIYLASKIYRFYAQKLQEYFFYQKIKFLKKNDFEVEIYSIEKEHIELSVFLKGENIPLKKKDTLASLDNKKSQKEIHFRFLFSHISEEILSQDYRFYKQLKNYRFTTKTKKCMRFFKKYSIA